jgi:DNA modification methylase
MQAKKKPAAPEPLTVEIWPIGRPKPYEKNARKLSERAIETLASSLKEFGWRQPIVVDAHDVIVAGHTRLLAALSLGMTEVPVHVARGLTPRQVRAYRIMDNRSADETDWDLTLLPEELAELQAMGLDLALTGFEIGELDQMMRPPPPEDEDTAPTPPKRPTTQEGDLWILGHRVLCGDATLPDATKRLLEPLSAAMAFTGPAMDEPEDPADAGKADLVFTDPPYNVDYTGYTKRKLKLKGDAMTPAQFIEFLGATFRSFAGAMKPTASLYVCLADKFQRDTQNALESASFSIRTTLIWAKNTFGWGFGRYKYQHETIFYCHLRGQSDRWFGDKTQSTLWAANKPAANRLHPTMKPIALIERALENSSKSRDIVLDLFGGSGSTLIACEKLGRCARLMELDPAYADVIVERWQIYTGKVATLDGDGRTFAEVKAARAGKK